MLGLLSTKNQSKTWSGEAAETRRVDRLWAIACVPASDCLCVKRCREAIAQKRYCKQSMAPPRLQAESWRPLESSSACWRFVLVHGAPCMEPRARMACNPVTLLLSHGLQSRCMTGVPVAAASGMEHACACTHARTHARTMHPQGIHLSAGDHYSHSSSPHSIPAAPTYTSITHTQERWLGRRRGSQSTLMRVAPRARPALAWAYAPHCRTSLRVPVCGAGWGAAWRTVCARCCNSARARSPFVPPARSPHPNARRCTATGFCSPLCVARARVLWQGARHLAKFRSVVDAPGSTLPRSPL